MPRRNLEYGYYHIYNRGFEKQIIFRNDNDFKRFYEVILKNLKIFKSIKLLSYTFLPNHFHFVISFSSTPGLENDLSKFMGNIQNAYSKYFKIKYDLAKGPLFEGRFKAKLIDNEEYLYKVLAYVNFNPLKHEIVKKISDYKWTSYHQINKDQIEKYKDFILEEFEY